MNLVTPTAGAKREVLLHKLVSDNISFVQLFFSMKLTHLSPVQH
jgi:hypothetical protein